MYLWHKKLSAVCENMRFKEDLENMCHLNHRRTRYIFLMILVHYIKNLLSNNEDEDCEINLFQNDNSLPFMLNKYSFNP